MLASPWSRHWPCRWHRHGGGRDRHWRDGVWGSASASRRAAYVARVQAIEERFGAKASRELLPVTRALIRDRPKAAWQIRRAAVVLIQEADALASVTPPIQVAQDHRAVIVYLRALSQEESGIARLVNVSATGESKPGEAASVLSRVKGAKSRYDAALRDFRQKGYELVDFPIGAEHVATTSP
jgi:hypothetical protein